MTDFSGQSTGRYHIIEKLGQGGMAVVYRAFDTTLEMDVAIKFLRMDRITPEMLDKAHKRFKIEAQKTAQLMHANIVQVIDYGEFQETPFLVMRFISGGKTLKSLMGRSISYNQAIQILLPVAHALEAAHQKGVVHRDVKPSNILLTEDGTPLLSDFGIAKILEDNANSEGLTTGGMAIGTPEYMAPEQWEGKPVDERVDIYALGVVLYEMITGRPPYKADTVPATMVQVLRDPLPRPQKWIPDLPEQVEHVLFKALAKDPQDRFSSMRLFSQALEKVLSSPANESDKQSPYGSGAGNLNNPNPVLEENEDETGEVTIDQLGDTKEDTDAVKRPLDTVPYPVDLQANLIEGNNASPNENESIGGKPVGRSSKEIPSSEIIDQKNVQPSSESPESASKKSTPGTANEDGAQSNWKKQKWLAFAVAALFIIGLIALIWSSFFSEQAQQVTEPVTLAATSNDTNRISENQVPASTSLPNNSSPTEAYEIMSAIDPTITPAPMDLSMCEKNSDKLCISAFARASLSNSILCILRQGQSFSGGYAMIIDDANFTCTSDSNYPDRLFCTGPDVAPGEMVRVDLYSLSPKSLIASGHVIVILPTIAPTNKPANPPERRYP